MRPMVGFSPDSVVVRGQGHDRLKALKGKLVTKGLASSKLSYKTKDEKNQGSKRPENVLLGLSSRNTAVVGREAGYTGR